MALRDDLVRAIEDSGAVVPAGLADDTPLISSGVLDSIALMKVALWVEGRIGGRLDMTAFDLVAEWDTIGRLLQFIERRRA